VVRPFRKTTSSRTLTDAFLGFGLHVFYDEQDRCEALELSAPAIVLLEERPLLGVSFADGERHLHALDAASVTDADGCTSHVLGVSLYCPADVAGARETIESVLVFQKGYFARTDG
jgi:hypothetical protein